jgi:hypothetical protein
VAKLKQLTVTYHECGTTNEHHGQHYHHHHSKEHHRHDHDKYGVIDPHFKLALYEMTKLLEELQNIDNIIPQIIAELTEYQP